MLRTGGSRSIKSNVLFNLVGQQPGIDKIYLCTNDPYEAKHRFFN